VKPYIHSLKKNNTLAKSLLKFTLNKKFIDKVIIGVENTEQLIENLDKSKEIQDLEAVNYIISKKILMPMYWPK
jgi:predicted aldo/keto reductase-like oxidoreductase